MTALAWDVVGMQFTAMPADTTETPAAVTGEPFVVPKGAGTCAIHAPDLLTASLKLQALDAQIAADGTQTWRDLYVFDLTDGTTEALDGIPENQVTVIPIAAIGGGVLRFVASADQAANAKLISVVFTRLR